MAYEEWQAVLKNRREVFAGSGYQVAFVIGVCGNNEGETGRQESWQAVRCATKTHSPEDREV